MLTRVEAIVAGLDVREMRHIILLNTSGDRYMREFFDSFDNVPPPTISIGHDQWVAGQVSGPAMAVVWYDKV